MKKLLVLTVAFVLVVSAMAFAAPYDHDVDIDVSWTVEPAFVVGVATVNEDAVLWVDTPYFNQRWGSGYGWTMEFDNTLPSSPFWGERQWLGGCEQEIFAYVASNDDWVLEFDKPNMVNSNENDDKEKPIRVITNYAKINSYAEPTLNKVKDTQAEFFAMNKGVGVHVFNWQVMVPFDEWDTYNGTYTTHLNIRFYQL